MLPTRPPNRRCAETVNRGCLIRPARSVSFYGSCMKWRNTPDWPEWREVKEYFGQKSSFGISDLHRHLNLHIPEGRAASRGRSFQTRLNFVPCGTDPFFPFLRQSQREMPSPRTPPFRTSLGTKKVLLQQVRGNILKMGIAMDEDGVAI